MKYYVVADVHGFYTELMSVLKEKGYFEDKNPHKLIICGDIFDRGLEAKQMQDFVLDLMKKDEVILIRGNHEDLALEFLDQASYLIHDKISLACSHHWSNGTVSTFLQLTNMTMSEMLSNRTKFVEKGHNTPYVREIIPKTVDYYETDKHIFVHGWIPCTQINGGANAYFFYDEDWREAKAFKWNAARWVNGIECGVQGVIVPDKTIVCGHFHTSYGHYNYGEAKSEFEDGANFEPFYGKGFVAIDACTAYTRKINCLVIDD